MCKWTISYYSTCNTSDIEIMNLRKVKKRGGRSNGKGMFVAE